MENNDKNSSMLNVVSINNPKTGDTITLLQAIGILFKHRFILLFFLIIGACVGLFIGNYLRPQYSSDALLQVDIQGSKNGSKMLGEMGELLDVSSRADAEIELIKSRMVLGYVVDEENLSYSATPIGFFDRILHREGRMDIKELYIPSQVRRKKFSARVLDDSTFAVFSSDDVELGRGLVGECVKAPIAGDTIRVIVKMMDAKPGQQFRLGLQNPLSAERSLARNLSVTERGIKTGIISVSYSHRYPDRAASILNTIANTYLRQNVEMRSAEAEKTLEFLQQQLPGVKAKLDSAEKKLSSYRHKIGSVDMSGETQAHLNREMDLQLKILQIEQERQKATRLFKEEHPTVQTLIKQQDKLRSELGKLKAKAGKMPITQQEMVRLNEEVQVNNAIYTNMLNNIQQLRVVRAGEVGNVRIVDFAQIEPRPVKPKKFNILICSIAASLMIGVLLIFVARMLHNGVRSSLEVERETNVSVYAKIPRVRSQKGVRLKSKDKYKPLILDDPEAPASEAIRSLQTSIDYMQNTGDEKKVISIVGISPSVGKSFISYNLASCLAISGKKVLLINADMRRGAVYSRHKLGLSDVLSSKCEFEDAIAESLFTALSNLKVMGAGKSTNAPSELLRGPRFGAILDKARAVFDYIIVDTPPISMVTDAEIIYPLSDLNVLVLRYGAHSMDEIKEHVEKIKRMSNKSLAFVMNFCEHELGGYYGYGYGYGYSYYGKYGRYGRYGRKNKNPLL